MCKSANCPMKIFDSADLEIALKQWNDLKMKFSCTSRELVSEICPIWFLIVLKCKIWLLHLISVCNVFMCGKMLIINYHQSYLLEKNDNRFKCNLKYLRDKILISGCNLIMDIEIILLYIQRISIFVFERFFFIVFYIPLLNLFTCCHKSSSKHNYWTS